jgi:hypothetical protein
MATKKADVTKHALSRRRPHIRNGFRLTDLTAVRGRPFDRHQPVRQMNGGESAPPFIERQDWIEMNGNESAPARHVAREFGRY